MITFRSSRPTSAPPLRRRRHAAGLVSALLLAPLLGAPADAAEPAPVPDYPPLGPAFPLGDGSAPKSGLTQLAPGVTYRVFSQGAADGSWAVWVRYADGQEMTTSTTTAETRAKELRDAGFPAAAVVPLPSPATADTKAMTLYGVHLTGYPTADAANAARTALNTAGFPSTRTFFTAETDPASKGPWQIRVITVAPGAQVDVRAEHGTDVSGSQTVKQMAAPLGALAAVNGAEFDIDSVNNPGFMGYEGVPQGLYVRDGVLLGAANNGRTALLMNAAGGGHRIAETSTRTWLSVPGKGERDADGINRVTGQVLGCGTPGDLLETSPGVSAPRPTPLRNAVCHDPDDIVIFRPEWGATTPAPAPRWAGTPMTEVVTDGSWKVVTVRHTPGAVPAGGRVIQGIGTGGAWLDTLVPGDRITPRTTITDAAGASVTSSKLSAVAGGTPALLRDGEIMLNPAANGMAHVSCAKPDPLTCRPSAALTSRHPRTLAGISPDGHLMLVTIDGRNPAHSVGATLVEAAQVMKWLGARDAVGLGSGGDTTLVVNGSLYNRPWDQWQDTAPRERPMSTAVVVVPRA
ncbi:phosphodiester glycosidase family protein [Streptomyces sp. NPDC090025]|uniref:phosphodiester glycosidase family protein n=1 Tax=Streptomyces sp. NPDC090025 TaxID=3365922 RepID=UPI003832F927